MKLGVALSNELRVLDYLERYVNDGSASGFTLHDQLSSKTNPLGMEPFFHPLSVASEEHEIERAFSELFECPDELLDILAHPDAKAELAEVGVSTNRQSSIRLVPTSSGRTSRILDDRRGYFVKLHYPGVLGGVDKRDSHLPRVLIQDCFLRSSHGSWRLVGCGMGVDRAAAAA